MSFNVFKGDRDQESVAYDMALILAAKETDASTPEKLIERIAELLPLCREIAESKHKQERPKPFHIPVKY